MNNNELVMDLGHGGTDPGAVANGLKEKDMNLVTGLACGKECERHGINVHYTRTTDKTVSLAERCSIANKTNAKWFVSIHHNAGGGDRGEVIHSITEGDGLTLANNISVNLKEIGQSAVKVYDKTSDSGKDYYYVIKNTKMKANIVEVCFIDNKEDVKIADTKEEQERNGIAIAHGILKTMGIAIKSEVQVKAQEEPKKVIIEDKLYKVCIGAFKDRNNATKLIEDAKKKGFTSAYMTIE